MRRNVAGQFVGAQLNSKTDGSAVTSGTTTVYVTGDAGTQTAGSVGSGVCTHEGSGFWTYAPAQAETNYTHVAFTFVNTSAVNATVQLYPTSYDANGRQDVGMFGGTAGTFASGRPEVNTTHVSGTSQTAGDIIGDTNDIQTKIGTPAVSVSADVAAVKVDTAAILVDTGTTLDGKLDTVDTVVDTILGQTGTTGVKLATDALDAAALATTAVDEIKAAIAAITITELGSIPAASPSLIQAIALVYMAIRNKRDTDSTAGTDEIHNDAGTVIATATVSEVGTLFTKGKYA